MGRSAPTLSVAWAEEMIVTIVEATSGLRGKTCRDTRRLNPTAPFPSSVNNPTLALDGISRARAKRLAKEFFWVGAGQVAAIIGGLAGIRLLTQSLSPASYGELALGMTAAALTQQVVLGPAAGAILRFFAPATEAKQLGDYLK